MKKNQSKKTTEKKPLILDRVQFIRWMFSDYDDRKCFFDRHNVLEDLISDGEFSITDESLLQTAGYIPVDVVHKSQKKDVILDRHGEVDTFQYSDIQFYKKKVN